MMMQFSFFQWLLIIISLLFLINGIKKLIRGEHKPTIFKFVFTLIIWGGVLFFSVFPNFPRQLSLRWGLGENLNFLIFLGFVLVFMAIFKLLSIIEKNEKNITEIVRKQALKDLDKYL